MVKENLPDSPLAAAQSLVLQGLKGNRRSHHLNNNNWKQAIHKTVCQILSK
jgi:hypothetical protein